MNENAIHAETSTEAPTEAQESYVPPSVEVISLDCEISSYAPDEGDTPLF